MIKLVDLLKEDKGEKYPPYMYSPVGFGCHVCEYYYLKNDKHYCNNKTYHYKNQMQSLPCHQLHWLISERHKR